MSDRVSAGQGETQTFEVALPAEAIELLYEVLGHFPHAPVSWSNLARARCSIALWDVRNAAPRG